MSLVQRPEEHDVLVLPNLYGDIVSDLTAGLVGGLGVAPGANIGVGAAVFEATHGSAPKYTGQNKVNPTAMILSGKLMLEHLGERDAAKRLEDAVAAVIDYLNGLQQKQISRTSGISIKPLSPEGSERIIRFGFEYAKANGRRRVSCITKANIMKHTDGLFLAVFREVAKDYPEIEAWETLVDALCMGLVQRPEEFDVLVLPNLYGDIISDLTAGLVGGLGVAPGANIGADAAVFEATHGSAPKYTGQNKVNPTAMILSGKLMLEHLGERDAAARLEAAVAAVIAEGKCVTYDLKPTRDDPSAVGTSEYADAIIARLA
jgi:isocitrate dehydrogenase (NAD+)